MITVEEVNAVAAVVVGRQTMYSTIQQYTSNMPFVPPFRRVVSLSPRSDRPRLATASDAS